MRNFKDFSVTERQWRHIRKRFIRFNEGERDCKICPMGWEGETAKSEVNREILFASGQVEYGHCLCQQFPEFKKSKEEGDCPCDVYKDPWRLLKKFVGRIEKEEANEK